VGGFVGSPPMNFIALPGEARVMGVRGEDFEIGAEGLDFTLRVAEPMGSHTLLTGTIAGQQVRVVAPSDIAVRPGAVLRLRPRPDRIRWMDAQTGAALESA
jgi:multiple sugar transport system ATP-binding protein